jgi:CheY-like chemotaxis protein
MSVKIRICEMLSARQLSYRVLVVDDEEKVLSLIEEMLSQADIRVTTAQTSRDALNFLRTQTFDLMITDVILDAEEVNGLELVRYARAKQPKLKSLFISGYSQPVVDDPEKDDFVPKPFRGRELLGCVYELIRREAPQRTRTATPERAADVTKAAAKVAGVRCAPARMGAASGPVLVVDDDEDVLEVAAAMIEDLGFSVLRATSGAAALDLFAANPDIALLVTDIVMPGMDGWELARAAKRRNPDLKVLYMSGYIKNRGSLPADEYGPVLSKPWRTQQLYEAMTQVLVAG